jgi:hypothetical protein
MKWHSSTSKLLRDITGLYDPLDVIAKIVADFRMEVGLDGPPYDMKVYASFRGISRIEEADLDCDGELLWSKRMIRVNRRHPPGRQNFSVAHEIVHTIINELCHKSDDIRCYSIGEYPGHLDQDLRAKEEEILCNHGAAELLMPMQDFIPRLRDYGPSIASISPLAQDFGVSKEAVANRIPTANLWCCASVVWEPSLKPCQFGQANPDQLTLPGWENVARPAEQLRVRYAVRSRTFDLWIPRYKSVSEDTTIFECLQTGVATQGLDSIEFGSGKVEQVYVESIPMDFYDDQFVQRRRVLSLLFREALLGS